MRTVRLWARIKKTGLAVGSLALVAACSGGATPATYEGTRLHGADDLITEMNSLWERERGTDVPSAVHEDSACFLLGTMGEDSFAASTDVACGPVRYAADETPGWDLFTVEVIEQEDDEVSLGPINGQRLVSQEWPEGRDALGGDGATPTLGVELAEPDAKVLTELTEWRADEFGPEFSMEHLHRTQSIYFPTGRISIQTAVLADKLGGRDNRWQAPPDQKLLGLSITFERADDERALRADDVVVGLGGHNLDMKFGTSTFMIPIDGDELSLQFDHFDVSQSVDLRTGERAADARLRGYYEGGRSAVVDNRRQWDPLPHFAFFESWPGASIDLLIDGTGCSPFGEPIPLDASCAFLTTDMSDLTQSRSPWLPDHGWAGDDKVWVTISTRLGQPLMGHSYQRTVNADNVEFARYKDVAFDFHPSLVSSSGTWTPEEVTLTDDTSSQSSTATARFRVPVEAGDLQFVQSAVISASDPDIYFLEDPEAVPSSTSITVETDPVNLQFSFREK